MRSALVAAVLTLSAVSALSGGCSLYLGHHHGDDDDCLVNAEDDAAPSFRLRDPQTGQCSDFGYGGGGYCCPDGADCAEPANTPAIPSGWNSCSGPCEGLTEGACLATPSCHAAYFDGDQGVPPQFWQCWETTGPYDIGYANDGECSSLEAEACSHRDDCIHLFAPIGSPFEACAPEPTLATCDNTTCDSGAHCEQQCTGPTCRAYCVPDVMCDLVDCAGGAMCVETCDSTTRTCTAACVAPTACGALATEADCKLRTDCDAIYKGTDCTCTPTVCTCAVETYDHCQERADPTN